MVNQVKSAEEFDSYINKKDVNATIVDFTATWY